MRLYHVTVLENSGSIRKNGIDPAYSRGARRESWYVTPGLLPWAILHVMSRHGCPLGRITAFEVLIAAKLLTRRRRGIYTCAVKVHPLFVVQALAAGEVAESYPCEPDYDMMKGG